MGFRLTLSLAHLGPEAGARLGHPPFVGTFLRPSPEARQHVTQTFPHVSA